jgi:hypothetical protein
MLSGSQQEAAALREAREAARGKEALTWAVLIGQIFKADPQKRAPLSLEIVR